MSYEMTPPTGNSNIAIIVIGLLVILLGLFIIMSVSLSRKGILAIEENRLLIKTIINKTNINIDDVEINSVRIIDMDKENISEHIRTNGIGLPGLSVGWFSGSKGKMKMYVTNRKSVLEIPTKKGYAIYFSTVDGDKIINEIKMSSEKISN